MKNIKKLLSVILIAFAMVTATAQQKKNSATSTAEAVEKRVEWMDSFLNLNESQEKKIRALLLSQMRSKKNKVAGKKGNYSYKKGVKSKEPVRKRYPSKKVQSDEKSFQKKLQLILTKEQWNRWQKKI